MLIININQIFIKIFKIFSLRKTTKYFDISFTSLGCSKQLQPRPRFKLFKFYLERYASVEESRWQRSQRRCDLGAMQSYMSSMKAGALSCLVISVTFRIFYNLHSLRTIGGRADLSRAVVSSTMRKVFVVASLALLFYFKGSLEYPNPATPYWYEQESNWSCWARARLI